MNAHIKIVNANMIDFDNGWLEGNIRILIGRHPGRKYCISASSFLGNETYAVIRSYEMLAAAKKIYSDAISKGVKVSFLCDGSEKKIKGASK